MVQEAVDDPVKYATAFGYAGTYWDYIKDMAADDIPISKLLNFSITKDEIADILKIAGFTGYRFDGALSWIQQAIEMIQALYYPAPKQ